MALVTEVWSERRFKRGESARQVFYVSDATDMEQAINAVGISKGNPFYLDGRLKAEQPDASSPKSPTQFFVEVSYSPLDGGGAESDVDKPPRWRLIPQKSQIAIDLDTFGNPIVNSARQTFDQPVSRDFTDLIYEYRRYETALNIAVSINYQDAINSDSVLLPGVGTISPGQGKLEIYAQEEDATRESESVLVLYRIACRADGWKTRLLDQSYVCLNGGNNLEVSEIYPLGSENPIGSPILLNGFGQPLHPANWRVRKSGAFVQPNTATTAPPGAEIEATDFARYLRYQIYRERPFAALSLTI